MLGTLLHMRGIMWTAMTDPDEWYGFHLDHYTRPPDQGYKTKDGHVYFGLRRGNSEDWDRLLISLGMIESLSDPRFAGFGRDATSIGRYAASKTAVGGGFKEMTTKVVQRIHEFNGDAVPFMEYPNSSTARQCPNVVQRSNIRRLGSSRPSVRCGVFRHAGKDSEPAANVGAAYRRGIGKLGLSREEMRRLENSGFWKP
jgi:crotonobetainyl-CoA:carnitine CoA-transferase CaiB-like acyl-CoA transferase